MGRTYRRDISWDSGKEKSFQKKKTSKRKKPSNKKFVNIDHYNDSGRPANFKKFGGRRK